jgi:hypothetical protein
VQHKHLKQFCENFGAPGKAMIHRILNSPLAFTVTKVIMQKHPSLDRERTKMLETLVQFDFNALWDNFVHLRISPQALITCIVFSTFGAVILGMFTGNFGNVTYPLNFSVLFIGSFLTNCVFNGFHIEALRYPHQVLIFTVAGMVSASFGLLWMSGAKRT